MDFRGSGTSYSTIRLRHAYFNLDWGKSAVLVGQTWHPLFGDVSPQILNLSVGAPFQPFSRAPQIRYRFTDKKFQLTGALVWQSQYLSQGPAGKSQEYIKKSNIPEIYVGADYKNGGLLAGVGIEMISLKPRTQSSWEDPTYDPGTNSTILTTRICKVDERITTLSYEAHVKYTNKNWFIGAKSVLGSNLTQAHRQQDKRAGIHSDTLLQLLAECSLRTEMETGNLCRIRQKLRYKRRISLRPTLWNRNQP